MVTRRKAVRTTLTEEQCHAITRALADPRRFAILEQIAASDSLPCSLLREQENISPATVSHHLKELAEAGLIEIERQGRSAQLTLQRKPWNAYLQRLGKL